MPTTGEVRALSLIVGASPIQDLSLHLYSNDVTPSPSDTANTYTEVSGGGYSAKRLFGSEWLIEGGEPSIAQYPPQEFLFSGLPRIISVFGYYVLQGDSLLWAERFRPEGGFRPPFIVTGLGDRVVITPVFTLRRASDARSDS